LFEGREAITTVALRGVFQEKGAERGSHKGKTEGKVYYLGDCRTV